MKIDRFEDLVSWKKARELVIATYRVTNEGQFLSDFGLRDQIRRAAISVMSNIAEGYSRQTDKEFIQFLYIAKGSTSELQSQLYIASDLGYISESMFKNIYSKAHEILKLLSGLIKYLKGSSTKEPRQTTCD